MEKLYNLLFLVISIFTVNTWCQSVDDVCRFRITGTFPHPNPQRCDLFVQCFSTVRECPSGSIFPPSGGRQCVPGDRNTCTIDPPQPTTTQSPPVTQTTTINPNICDGIGTGIVEIPGDCTRFMLCILDEGTVIKCNSNEVFYLMEGGCVPGNPLTCEVFTTAVPTTTSTTTTSTTTTRTSSTFPTTTSSSLTTNPSTPPIGNVCSGNNFRFVSDPNVCYQYFFCIYGIAVPGECRFGRIFIEFLQTCVPGSRTTCKPFM